MRFNGSVLSPFTFIYYVFRIFGSTAQWLNYLTISDGQEERGRVAHFGTKAFCAVSMEGVYDLRSITGESLKASIESIRMTLPLMDRILQTDRPIRLGLQGEWQANTPVKGLLILCLGWTRKTLLFSGVSFL